jgi:hypothetical protein
MSQQVAEEAHDIRALEGPSTHLHQQPAAWCETTDH